MGALERFAGQKVGILGMAASGRAAAKALSAAGADVLAYDDRASALQGFQAGHADQIADLALLVASPGVPLTHPLIVAAEHAGVPLGGDIDLLADMLGQRAVVGITGTNGKSTVTALIHHLLVTSGRDAVLGGNIGRPVLELEPGPEDRIFVLELSSFQLDLCRRLRCRVAVWLNLAPDHLDRHGDLAAYIAAKERIFACQGPEDVVVIGIDDPVSRDLAYRLRAEGRRVVTVSLDEAVPGEIEVVGGRLIDMLDDAPIEAIDLRALGNLRGQHNWQNAAAAYAAVRLLGSTPEQAISGLPSFKGLPHRMEEVARAGRVIWINDSKATNPDSAAMSLASYPSIYWIAGGKAKPGGFTRLRPLMGAVRQGYLIGAAAAEIKVDLGDFAPLHEVGTLEAAVRAAAHDASADTGPESVILLAPACASFDQFANFEARGDAFRALAAALAREHAA